MRSFRFPIQYQQGFSLFEVIFMLLMMIALVPAIVSIFQNVSSKQPMIVQQQVATQLASERMELILSQRFSNGFGSTIDPCNMTPSNVYCSAPNGYKVSSSISNNWNSNPDYKVISVNVSGKGHARLQTLVSDY